MTKPIAIANLRGLTWGLTLSIGLLPVVFAEGCSDAPTDSDRMGQAAQRVEMIDAGLEEAPPPRQLCEQDSECSSGACVGGFCAPNCNIHNSSDGTTTSKWSWALEACTCADTDLSFPLLDCNICPSTCAAKADGRRCSNGETGYCSMGTCTTDCGHAGQRACPMEGTNEFQPPVYAYECFGGRTSGGVTQPGATIAFSGTGVPMCIGDGEIGGKCLPNGGTCMQGEPATVDGTCVCLSGQPPETTSLGTCGNETTGEFRIECNGQPMTAGNKCPGTMVVTCLKPSGCPDQTADYITCDGGPHLPFPQTFQLGDCDEVFVLTSGQ